MGVTAMVRPRPRSSSTVLRLRPRPASRLRYRHTAVAVSSGRAIRLDGTVRLRFQYRVYGRYSRASDRGYGRASSSMQPAVASRLRPRPDYGHCGTGYGLDRLYGLDRGNAPRRADSRSKAPCYAIGSRVPDYGLYRVLDRYSTLQSGIRSYTCLPHATGYGCTVELALAHTAIDGYGRDRLTLSLATP